MAVDRCVCVDVGFDELKRLSQEQGLSADQLRRVTGCGGGCGLCVPYIHVMLRTGLTSLPVMKAYEFRSILKKPLPCIARS